MRERLARFASVWALVMAVMVSPCARAQQQTGRAGGDEKSTAHMSQTIHGVVAGVTAEGEVFFNHQTNTAVKAEAAFLTIVGSPVQSEAAEREHRSSAATERERERRATGAANERHGEAGGRRHNIYIVWLTPKTKVCEMMHELGTAEHARSSEHAKKEVDCDRLEVGDRVEVQFMHEEESAAHRGVHQSQQMRERHGRHRTHVGYATAITILPPREHGQSSSESGKRSNEGSK